MVVLRFMVGQAMGMRIAAAVLAAVMTAPAASGQALVISGNGEWAVSASYAYSQRHHADDPWIQIDVGLGGDRRWTIHPHSAFYLLTPDGERIDLPDQREFRRGRDDIRAMYARAATMQYSPWLAFSGCRFMAFAGWQDAVDHLYGGDARGTSFESIPLRSDLCRTWRMWGNGGVDWAVTVGPDVYGGASLFFKAPADSWPAGRYTLVVEGPGDSVARLPINLDAAAPDEAVRTAPR